MVNVNKFPTIPQVSWAFYDFANSIFFVNVASVYFPIYYVTVLGGSDLAFSIAFAAAQLLTGTTAIFWGRFADQTKKYRKLFIAFTLLTMLCTLFISLVGNTFVLVIFLMAFYFFATTSIFYDSLLPNITSQKTLPLVAGLGGFLGLLGNVAALFLVAPFLGKLGVEIVFGITALAFLVFALPALTMVRPRIAKGSQMQFSLALRHLQSWLKRFLSARIIYGGILVTLVIHTPLMGKQLFGLDDGQIRIFYALVSIAAAFGALLSGPICRKFGALRVLIFTLAAWALLQLIMAAFLSPTVYYTAIVIGFLAGLDQSADRIYFISRATGEHLGEYLGFHRLAYIAGGVITPLAFSGALRIFDGDLIVAYKMGLAILAFLLLITVIILFPLNKSPKATP